MIIVRTTLKVFPEKQLEVIQTLLSLIEPVGGEPGHSYANRLKFRFIRWAGPGGWRQFTQSGKTRKNDYL